MKRIQCACLEQTIHFELKEGLERTEAEALARQELESYKQGLDRRRTRYQVVDEQKQPDGSIVMRMKKQYNDYPCGSYLA